MQKRMEGTKDADSMEATCIRLWHFTYARFYA